MTTVTRFLNAYARRSYRGTAAAGSFRTRARDHLFASTGYHKSGFLNMEDDNLQYRPSVEIKRVRAAYVKACETHGQAAVDAYLMRCCRPLFAGLTIEAAGFLRVKKAWSLNHRVRSVLWLFFFYGCYRALAALTYESVDHALTRLAYVPVAEKQHLQFFQRFARVCKKRGLSSSELLHEPETLLVLCAGLDYDAVELALKLAPEWKASFQDLQTTVESLKD